ncbi:Tubulin polyglutamylase TTLL7 [Acipenser ruthenus]|uniref:Tubulin polyglutamylase TTLL7 n=1 Tax=Acipenser ruthenus TaxID=7906 RepID=A0A662YWT6_ACIRT|nr:Tubulin polyglutamylase TTLL7 [Acipenser ruthenus]
MQKHSGGNVRVVIDEMVFMKTRDEDDTANLIWNDSAVQHEKIAELRNYQRINHFPGMGEICRKDCLARNMAKMIKSQSQEYGFIPKTWIFPAEYTQFQNYVKELRKKRKQKTFIVKPANGAMGHGISLIRNCEKLPAQDHFIVQEYLDKPFLMEGYKFDLRIYILVTSCDPLRIFLYNDGLVRMGTEKYHTPSDTNLSQLYMHLTNYSVNKHNENFERDETADKGSKRSISWFTEFLRTNDYDVSKFWGDVSELVVKTLIVAEPHVLHAYRMCRPGQPPGSDSVCFEILGFDIILDRKLKPWLLEINRAPSFGTDQKIDYDVKKGVLLNALRLLNIRASDKKRNLAQQKAEAQKRLYGRGSVKRLSPCSSEWEKQRHTLERRREELKERLAQEEDILDLLEQCELDDEKLMGKSTKQRGPKPLSSMPESTQVPKKQRDDSSNTSCNSSSTSASEEEDEKEDLLETKEKKVSYNLEENKYQSLERSSRINSKSPIKPTKAGPSASPSLSAPIRRSISCPRSISSVTAQSPTNEQRAVSSKLSAPVLRTSSVTRSHSLNRSGSVNRVPHSTSLGTIHSAVASLKKAFFVKRNIMWILVCIAFISESLLNLRTKEQEAAMTRQTLAALNEMRIQFPGKTEEEAELMLDDILDNWKYHKPKVASYWLVKLDSTKQRKVLDIVRTNLRSAVQRIWKEPDVDSLHIYRLFSRVFNRLLWSHGQGLWNCFSNSGSSWETIFNKSTELVTPQELQCCQRLVQLCRDCLLVVYKFVADSRGSLTGLSPEWDDTRYLWPVTSQFIMKSPPSSFNRPPSGMPRSRSLFSTRVGQF